MSQLCMSEWALLFIDMLIHEAFCGSQIDQSMHILLCYSMHVKACCNESFYAILILVWMPLQVLLCIYACTITGYMYRCMGKSVFQSFIRALMSQPMHSKHSKELVYLSFPQVNGPLIAHYIHLSCYFSSNRKRLWIMWAWWILWEMVAWALLMPWSKIGSFG